MHWLHQPMQYSYIILQYWWLDQQPMGSMQSMPNNHQSTPALAFIHYLSTMISKSIHLLFPSHRMMILLNCILGYSQHKCQTHTTQLIHHSSPTPSMHHNSWNWNHIIPTSWVIDLDSYWLSQIISYSQPHYYILIIP